MSFAGPKEKELVHKHQECPFLRFQDHPADELKNRTSFVVRAQLSRLLEEQQSCPGSYCKLERKERNDCWLCWNDQPRSHSGHLRLQESIRQGWTFLRTLPRPLHSLDTKLLHEEPKSSAINYCHLSWGTQWRASQTPVLVRSARPAWNHQGGQSQDQKSRLQPKDRLSLGQQEAKLPHFRKGRKRKDLELLQSNPRQRHLRGSVKRRLSRVPSRQRQRAWGARKLHPSLVQNRLWKWRDPSGCACRGYLQSMLRVLQLDRSSESACLPAVRQQIRQAVQRDWRRVRLGGKGIGPEEQALLFVIVHSNSCSILNLILNLAFPYFIIFYTVYYNC